MLNAVLFDLDNTLIDRDQAFRDCVRHSFHDPAVQHEIIELDGSGAGDRSTLFDRWEQRSGCRMNQSLFGRMIAERLRPDPTLLSELRSLSRRVKIGIITNGGRETQRQKLAAAGFKDLFASEHIWISEEVGSAKPAARIFRAALSALRQPPERCLFIGDRKDHDVRGALSVGMRARLVDHVLNGSTLKELVEQERAR